MYNKIKNNADKACSKHYKNNSWFNYLENSSFMTIELR